MRGKRIQLASQLNRQRQVDITNLEKDLKSLSKAHKRNPTPNSLSKLEASRIALNLALTSSAAKHLRWMSEHFYLQNDKIGPQLTAKLSPKHQTYSLPKMKSGTLSQNPKRILEAFHSFYFNLYSKDSIGKLPGGYSPP